MRRRSGWWVIAPALACAVPLLIGQDAGEGEGGGAPQEEEEEDGGEIEGEDAGDALTSSRPLLPMTSHPRDQHHELASHLRQEPFLLERADGRPLLGYLDWTPDRNDRIFFSNIAPGFEPTRDLKQNFALPPEPVEMVRPIAVMGPGDRIHAFWTQLERGVGQIAWAREIVEGVFTQPLLLTSGPLVSMNVEAAVHDDGSLWLAWEAELPAAEGSDRAEREVLCARLEEGARKGEAKLGETLRVGAGPFSEIDPDVVSAGGRLWVAWAGFTGRDYEIRLRSIDPATLAMGEVVEVSADGRSDDLHPNLAASAAGEVWVAWDRVEIPWRGASLPNDLWPDASPGSIDVSVRCAQVKDGAVRVPKARHPEVEDGIVEGAPLLSAAGGLPKIAFDRRGTLWIAYRHLIRVGTRLRDGAPVLVQHLSPTGWSDPVQIESSVGWPEEPAVAPHEDGIRVAFYCDPRFDRKASAGRYAIPATILSPLAAKGVRFERWWGGSGIGIADLVAPEAPVGQPEMRERISRAGEAHFHPLGDRLDDPIVNGRDHFEVVRGEDRWSVYWGDLHRHSTLSRCSRGEEPMPADRWASGRDVHLCDFMALTDHAGQTDPQSWRLLDRLCVLYRSPSFVTLAGYEWSTVEYGHHNVILPDRITPLVADSDEIRDLYARLIEGKAVTIPHHPSETAFPNTFKDCRDEKTRLIEVYQARRGNYEFDGCFRQAPGAGVLGSFAQDALDQGHHFGIIAASDHGYGQAYACVLAEKLDRKSIFEALYDRRTYGATTKGMLIDLRVDDAVMGEEVRCSKPPRIRLHALGAAELADVVVFRNGRVFQRTGTASEVANRFAPVRLVLELPVGGIAQEGDWTLEVRCDGASFGTLVDQRSFTRRHEATPGWSAEGSTATFRLPAGFEVRPPSADHPIHLHAPPGSKITVTTPSGPISRAWSELLAEPLRGAAPGGEFVLSLDLGDASIRLEPGLGVKEFTGEWEDPEVRTGISWYYARIVQVDGEMAWSSPVFVQRN